MPRRPRCGQNVREAIRIDLEGLLYPQAGPAREATAPFADFRLFQTRTPYLDGRLGKIFCILRKQRRRLIEQRLLEKSQNVGV